MLVPVADVTRALDVSGNSDAKGANVQVWKRNAKSGQYVSVTGSGSKQVLRFPLTGKVLDVYDAKAKNGQNVIQWVANNGNGQAWNIVATGGTATVSGHSYSTYWIKSALSNSYALAVSSASPSDGTNVVIKTFSSTSSAQKWVFWPVALLPKGDYRLVCALDTNSCIAAANGKDGGNVVVAGEDLESNNQIWRISGDAASATVMNVGSKCYLNAAGNTQGSNANQKAKENGLATSWLLTFEGNMMYRMSVCPMVRIRCADGNELNLDSGGGANKLSTSAMLYTTRSGEGQLFIAVPTSPIDTSIPAPSDPRMAYSKGGAGYSDIWGSGKTTAYPTWISGYSQFQFRYRSRVRKATAGDDSFSSWSPWQFYGGDTSNEGWGDVTKANAKPTSQKDPNGQARKYNTAHQYTLSPTGNDLVEYQYQVRAVSNGKRGAVATRTGRYKYRPTYTHQGFTWAPDGLRLKYSSDQKRGNNDLVIFSVKCVHGGKTYTVFDGGSAGYPVNDIPWSGTALLPQSKLKYVPDEGDVVTAVIRFSNVDGAYMTSKQTISSACSHGSGKGMTINPTVEVTEGKMLHVVDNVQSATKRTLWIDYGNDLKGFSRYADADGEWLIPVLFGRAYTIYVMVEDGSRWDVWTRQMPAVEDPGSYWLNFENASTGEQDWAQVKVEAGSAPRFGRSVAYDSTSHLTNGNSLQVVHFGTARAEDVDLDGAIGVSIANSTVAKMDALVNAHYAWLRSSRSGTAWRVAVMSASYDYTDPSYVSAKLVLKRINNPADW